MSGFKGPIAPGLSVSKKPITGTIRCCDYAASDHAAMLLKPAMNGIRAFTERSVNELLQLCPTLRWVVFVVRFGFGPIAVACAWDRRDQCNELA